MTDELKTLIEKAKDMRMDANEREQQRRSFAYGNTNIENGRITRKTVDDEADRLRREKRA